MFLGFENPLVSCTELRHPQTFGHMAYVWTGMLIGRLDHAHRHFPALQAAPGVWGTRRWGAPPPRRWDSPSAGSAAADEYLNVQKTTHLINPTSHQHQLMNVQQKTWDNTLRNHKRINGSEVGVAVCWLIIFKMRKAEDVAGVLPDYEYFLNRHKLLEKPTDLHYCLAETWYFCIFFGYWGGGGTWGQKSQSHTGHTNSMLERKSEGNTIIWINTIN